MPENENNIDTNILKLNIGGTSQLEGWKNLNIQPGSDVDFVVTPRFTSFKAGGPVVVKLEKYWVELGIKTTIYDKSGNVLDAPEFKEKGSKGGTLGFNPGTHVYPEVCREAIKPIVKKTVERLFALSP